MPKPKDKPSLRERLTAQDDRPPSKREVKNAIRRIPRKGPSGGESYTAKVLPNGLGLIQRMARRGQSKGSIAHALGISTEKFNEAMRDDPAVMNAFTAGLSGLEDELSDILLHHARQRDGKTSLIAAIYLSKARCGWRDNNEPREESRPNVQIINLPDSKSPEEWMRSIMAPTTKGELPR